MHNAGSAATRAASAPSSTTRTGGSPGWAKTVGGFGQAYKASVKAGYPAFMQFTPYGEMLPNAQSYVDLDPERNDKFGLPQPRRHVRWGANEEALFNDMVRWSLAMLEKAGAEILTVPDGPAPNHELGGCRMGRDPRDLGRQRRLPHARRARTSTSSMAACSRRRPRRTRRTRSWRWPPAPPSTSPSGCERVTCDARRGDTPSRCSARSALTCAFPFSGDELYGQHVHATLAQTPATGPYTPAFFTPAEYATLSRLTDVIIPPTDTPGASARRRARVYRSRGLAERRASAPRACGLAWLEQQAQDRFSQDLLVARTKPSTSRSCSRSATRSIASGATRRAGGFEPTRRAASSITSRSPTGRRRRPQRTRAPLACPSGSSASSRT